MTKFKSSYKMEVSHFVGGFFMRVIRIGERYSIATGEVETYDLLPVKTYVAMCNERDGFYLTEHPNIGKRQIASTFRF